MDRSWQRAASAFPLVDDWPRPSPDRPREERFAHRGIVIWIDVPAGPLIRDARMIALAGAQFPDRAIARCFRIHDARLVPDVEKPERVADFMHDDLSGHLDRSARADRVHDER